MNLVSIVVTAALALGAPAAALAAPSAPSPTGPIIDPLHLFPTAPATSGAREREDSAGPLSELSSLFASDFASAANLATATSIKDGNGAACWTAFGPFGELVKAHPRVFSGKLATDIEAQRLIVIAARNLCNNVACATVFTEAATAVSKVTSALPVSINVNITPINLFAKACADVPTIQVITPAAAEAETPTPPTMVPVAKPTETPSITPTPTPTAQ